MSVRRTAGNWPEITSPERVGTSRCDVPGRVQRAERTRQDVRAAAGVAPLYAARTAQRAVPTTLSRCRVGGPRYAHAMRHLPCSRLGQCTDRTTRVMQNEFIEWALNPKLGIEEAYGA